MRLVAIAQHLARREAGRPPRRRAARRAAPIVEFDGDTSSEGDDEDEEDAAVAVPRRRIAQRGAATAVRGVLAELGARVAVLRNRSDAMHTFWKVGLHCALNSNFPLHHAFQLITSNEPLDPWRHWKLCEIGRRATPVNYQLVAAATVSCLIAG